MSARAKTAPSPAVWTRANITLFTADGPTTVLGFVSPVIAGLAVTPVPGSSPDWTVTHVGSGFAISFREHPNVGRFRTIDGAKLAAIALSRLASWATVSAEDLRANEQLQLRIRDVLCAVEEGR